MKTYCIHNAFFVSSQKKEVKGGGLEILMGQLFNERLSAVGLLTCGRPLGAEGARIRE